MTNRPPVVLAILLAAAPTTASGEADLPVAVSPGHPSRMSVVADRCPTFSWGQVSGVDSYELMVYRVDRDEDGAVAELRATIDGRAGSWTPTLGGCLERGGRYAWSRRALGAETTSAWSSPVLFQVAAGLSPAELDEALAVLRDHVAAGGSLEPRAAGAGPFGSSTGSGAASHRRAGARPGTTSESEDAGEGVDSPEPGKDPSAASFSVDGVIEATSFSGDGSGLSSVQAVGLSCVDCVAGGQIEDGAVTAAKIGAACASGQVLVRGVAAWECATLTAPGCTPGDEVVCYTGLLATRGVGECLGGTRTCVGDSTWGACSGEVTPAAAEACDGLDNTCDGSTDEGDPATLCPLTPNATSTLCDAAACAVTGCDALWADADGEYANGCEAPAPGACLDGGVPRPIVAPLEGDLVIQEILADPASPLADADAEWFEIAVKADVDLNGLGIGTTFGTVIDQIDSADCLAIQDGNLLLLVRSADPATNGGLTGDWTFGFSLVNGGGDLHLAHGGNLVDAVSWGAGDIASGRARNLPPGLQDASANDDQANWCNVAEDPGLLYSAGNYGSPGLANGICP